MRVAIVLGVGRSTARRMVSRNGEKFREKGKSKETLAGLCGFVRDRGVVVVHREKSPVYFVGREIVSIPL